MPKILTSWNELAEEVEGVPMEFAVAVSSGRGDMARLIRRPLSLEETRAVARLLSTLIETNQKLQRHSAQLADRASNIVGTYKGLMHQLDGLKLQAQFRDESDEGEDG